MANTKVYPKGFFINAPREGAPEFVLGSLSVSVDSFIEFLNTNKQLINDKGYLRLDMLQGDEKPYVVVNTYGLEESKASAPKEGKPLHVDGDLPF